MTDDPLEQEIRAAMRAHHHEAPTGLRLPDQPGEAGPARGRSLSWLPLAAAGAVVVLLVGLTVALNIGKNNGDPSFGRRVDSNNVLLCPDEYQVVRAGSPWVPAQPDGVDGAHRLVPASTPQHAVVCDFATEPVRSTRTTVPLRGRKVLTGDLNSVTRSLTYTPRTHANDCGFYGKQANSADYLVGLTYVTGTLWVSAPSAGCRGSSNGVFSTSVDTSVYAAAAFETGHWVPDADELPAALRGLGVGGPCTAPGRLGQEHRMVPGRPDSLRVCRSNKTVATASGPRAADLIAALNAAPTEPTRGRCSGPGAAVQPYDLIFGYPVGPAVRVSVTEDCLGPFDNGSLRATAAGEVPRLIARLVP